MPNDKQRSWADDLEKVAKAVGVLSIIFGGVFSLVSYWSQRNQELTKPYREAQLRMCQDVVAAAGKASIGFQDLMADMTMQRMVENTPPGQKMQDIEKPAYAYKKLISAFTVDTSGAMLFGNKVLNVATRNVTRTFGDCSPYFAEVLKGNLDGREVLSTCGSCLEMRVARVGAECRQLMSAWWPSQDSSSRETLDSLHQTLLSLRDPAGIAHKVCPDQFAQQSH